MSQPPPSSLSLSLLQRDFKGRLAGFQALVTELLMALQCGAVHCGAVHCGAVQYIVVQCSTLWCSAVYCGAVQCIVVQCNVKCALCLNEIYNEILRM